VPGVLLLIATLFVVDITIVTLFVYDLMRLCFILGDVSEEAELRCVPGSFESVEEYVRVFEPLLFEECRAQLYSTYEELPESVSRDTYFTVRVKMVERRERGLLPFAYFFHFFDQI
jgi:hypothetical protein